MQVRGMCPFLYNNKVQLYGEKNGFAVFLIAARKQVITKHQAGNNNQDSKETVAHEKHDTHTDTNPE